MHCVVNVQTSKHVSVALPYSCKTLVCSRITLKSWG